MVQDLASWWKEAEKRYIAMKQKERSAWAKTLSRGELLYRDRTGMSLLDQLLYTNAFPAELMTEEYLSLPCRHTSCRETVAHLLADRGRLPAGKMTEQILKLKDYNGDTVALFLARKDRLPKKFIRKNILVLRNGGNRTVAHEFVRTHPLPEKLLREEAGTSDSLLLLADDSGRTVAHEMARGGNFPDEYITEEILFVKDSNGVTVAHELASSGTLPARFQRKDILNMTDDTSLKATVATAFLRHMEKTYSDFSFLTPAILRAKTWYGGGSMMPQIIGRLYNMQIYTERITKVLCSLREDSLRMIAPKITKSPLKELFLQEILLRDKTTENSVFCAEDPADPEMGELPDNGIETLYFQR